MYSIIDVRIKTIILLLFVFNALAQKLYCQVDVPKTQSEKQQYFREMLQMQQWGVQSRLDWRYVLIDGNVTTSKYLERKIHYDTSGRIKEIENFTKDNRKLSIVEFLYGDTKVLTEKNEYLPTGELKNKVQYRYDSSGYISEISYYDARRYITSKWVYERVAENNSIVVSEYLPPDKPDRQWIYTYEDFYNGKESGMDSYEKKKLKFSKRNIWDEENKRISAEVFFNPQGDEVYRLEYNYDIQGNKAAVDRIFPNLTKVKKSIYNYNEKNLLSGFIDHNINGSIVEYYKFTYIFKE
ncbi:MAG: hypothetical protein JXJ22_13810 [Bacteroidales bacterium]|nr:hypothetical protein [Bacteroidales bacterium]